MQTTKRRILDLSKSMTLNERIHQVIPGGAHTYAKGDDQFPEFYLPIMQRGEGCYAWDVDGNRYIEYGMGLRSVTLGHAYPPVIEAAYRQMKLGANFTRPSVIELEAAERFLSLVPGAEMVKFGKNGSDATTAALKLARAYTGRDLVAICKDHPFFSIDDWFIGSTAIDRGIPDSIKNQTLTFRYNDLSSLQALFETYPNQIACIFLEPEKGDPPLDRFLHKVKDLCHQHGALFILDEMITGFRWHLGGAQTLYNIVPDLSTFGKAMGNGFAISALAGKREFMELGGLHDDRERVFLLSTTHGAETHALAAFLAVAATYEHYDVVEVLRRQGMRLKEGLQRSIKRHNLEDYVSVPGHPACLVCATADKSGPGSQPFRTLMLQEIMKQGIIAPNLVISFAHQDDQVDETIDVFDHAFGIYRKALDEGIENYLVGRSVQPVYRKWNNLKNGRHH
ncbi:MAG: glutamate-1-semialdehyde 2,1-aminomutase [Saprospiraceae bacterium]|nr:glutamate-1-semialdehyde 2,1-aminomutase [Saprospiraceae bacterium]